MERAHLIRRYPKLFHMAAADSWPSIARHGLLSTQALLDLFEVPEPSRSLLLGSRRAESEPLTHRTMGAAVVRDQLPLNVKKLAGCLDEGTSVEQWLRLLNARVFFWVRPKRLETLLAARAYRSSDHLVITIDTERLLDRVPESAITLSHLNTGSTAYKAAARGPGTFRSLADYQRKDVVEFCVADRLTDIEEVADLAEIRGVSPRRVVWQREPIRS